MANEFKLILDLDDDLPPTEVVVGRKPDKKATATTYGGGLPTVTITSTPTAIVASYATIHCLSCNGETREFRGLFLENTLSNGVRALSRKTLRELAPFKMLPRKLDLAPAEAVEICPECFMLERLFSQALAAAQVQGELPLFDTAPSEHKPSGLEFLLEDALL